MKQVEVKVDKVVQKDKEGQKGDKASRGDEASRVASQGRQRESRELSKSSDKAKGDRAGPETTHVKVDRKSLGD